MPAHALTSEFLATLPGRGPVSGAVSFFDTEIKGFLLELRASGGATFYFRYLSHPGRSYGRLWNRSGREAYHSFMACIGVLLFNADCGSWWLYKVT